MLALWRVCSPRAASLMQSLCMLFWASESRELLLGLLHLPSPACDPFLRGLHETRGLLLCFLCLQLGEREALPQPREPLGEGRSTLLELAQGVFCLLHHVLPLVQAGLNLLDFPLVLSEVLRQCSSLAQGT